MVLTFISQSQDPLRLDLFLRREGFSASLIRSIKFSSPGFLVNGVAAKTNQKLLQEDNVSVFLPSGQDNILLSAEDIPLEVLYCSQHALVVNKPTGMAIHPTWSHKSGTLGNAYMNWLLKNGLHARAFRTIGRLDVGTSGVVLCAMNAYAALILKKTVKKRYFAIAHGLLEDKSGQIVLPIAPCADSIIKQQVAENGKDSITNYEVIAEQNNLSLLEISIETGRTHQIRVHFSHIGHPLLGDSLYGEASGAISRHALHAFQTSFLEPQEGEVTVIARFPKDMHQVLQDSGFDVESLSEKILLQKAGGG